MSKKFKQQEISLDPIYNDILVSRFINQIMRNGKKSLARRIVYSAFEQIKKETKKDPLEVFKKALGVAKPTVEVKPRRVGGATYQVPKEVGEKRGVSLAIRWLVAAAKAKKKGTMGEKLSQEIILAFKNEGEVIRKKTNLYKMAEANKAFAYLKR